jgi:hypothetical protein
MSPPNSSEALSIYARRKWSAEQLDIPVAASKKEARAQWLRGLEEADFLPDEIYPPAWRIVSDAECAVDARTRFPLWASRFDDAMSQEIEAYAQRFFSLDRDERRQEFTRLFNACRDNPLHQKRLSSFSLGLKLPAVNDPTPFKDDDAELRLADVEEVAEHFRNLFVLAPSARARLHQEFLRQRAAELPRWATAAKILKETEPAIAELVPEEWEELTAWDLRQRESRAFQANLEQRVALQALKAQRAESAAANRDASTFLEGLLFNRYAMIAVVWIAIRIVSGLATSSPGPSNDYGNVPLLPSGSQKAEEYVQRLGQLGRKNNEARRWVTMEEEEFEASNGEEEIRRLGLEKERMEYWEWKARVNSYEQMLDEKIELRDRLQLDIQVAKGRETVLNLQPPADPDSQKAGDEFILEAQSDIRVSQFEIQGDIRNVEGNITRLQIILAGLYTADPSKKLLDATP